MIQAFADIRTSGASEAQIQALQKSLGNGMTPVDLYSRLLSDNYFSHMGFIGRLYQAILSRKPDLDGARYYYHQLALGLSKYSIVDQFIHSTEFESIYGELVDEDFINLIHLNTLGRPARQKELDFYLSQMNNVNFNGVKVSEQSVSTGAVLLAFIESIEYVRAFDLQSRVDVLSLLLNGVLPDEPQSSQYQLWLRNEDSAKSVLRALLASNDYRQRRMENIPAASFDSDKDGKPDGIEFVDGSDAHVKDNDVMGDQLSFVRQVMRDNGVEIISSKVFSKQVLALKSDSDRANWVKLLLQASGEMTAAKVYQLFYRRNINKSELVRWHEQLSQGRTEADLIETMIQSSEYQARFY